jgi:hypothetical protein
MQAIAVAFEITEEINAVALGEERKIGKKKKKEEEEILFHD